MYVWVFLWRAGGGEGQWQHVQTEETDAHVTKSRPGIESQQDYTLRLNTDKGQSQNKWRDRRDTLPKGESQHIEQQWKENR